MNQWPYFEPVGHKNDVDKHVTTELTSYKQALRGFRSQNWDKAEMDFFNLSRSDPKRLLYQVYMDRIAFYRNNPPDADWDGGFTHENK